jgi:hypothetical protein
MTLEEARKKATPGELMDGVWDGDDTSIWTDDSLATLARFKSPDESRYALHCRNHFDEVVGALGRAIQQLGSVRCNLKENTLGRAETDCVIRDTSEVLARAKEVKG